MPVLSAMVSIVCLPCGVLRIFNKGDASACLLATSFESLTLLAQVFPPSTSVLLSSGVNGLASGKRFLIVSLKFEIFSAIPLNKLL